MDWTELANKHRRGDGLPKMIREPSPSDGWLTGISDGGFQESLYYADGLDKECYNGNISTMKWKAAGDGYYQGYNLEYDDCNRLSNALYGSGDNLTGCKSFFNEYAEYDCNGNITRLQRRGLTNKNYGGFGLVDDLHLTYAGNMLTSVRDNASRQSYAGATDFDGVTGREYPLTYDDAGSLKSDAGRKIARIDYDCRNNPVRIQFTDGNVTKYVYSAGGEKLRVIYQTAVPNITVAIGSSRELAPSEIQYTDSTDYLLGGSLTLKNGRIDRYQFEEGYCRAEKYANNASLDRFTFCYYSRDHLGNIRQVTEADGTHSGKIIQRINYYPFGAEFCDGSTYSSIQPYKYNGKEFDRMHGLNTYDYGARQYNPVTARWDRMDPLAEKYYSVSPYAYCMNNPVNAIDPDGENPIFDTCGNLLGCTSEGYTGQVYVYKGNETMDWQKQTMDDILEKDDVGNFLTFEAVESSYSGDAKANFVSKVMTDIVGHAENKKIFEYSFSTSTLYRGGIGFSLKSGSYFTTEKRKGENKIRIDAHEDIGRDYEATVENLSASLLVHEWYSHGVKGYGDANNNHRLAYSNVMRDKTFYPKTTIKYKNFVRNMYNKYKNREIKR